MRAEDCDGQTKSALQARLAIARLASTPASVRSEEIAVLIDEHRTFCYLGGGRLQHALANPKVLDALIEQLQVPGRRSVLRALSATAKLSAIEAQIAHFTRSTTSIWFEVEPAEVLAVSIWRSDLGPRLVLGEIFSDVGRESDLLVPVRHWLTLEGFNPYTEVPMGRGRVDVVGHRAGGWLRGSRVVAVELKNDLDQLKRGLDQMTTFADYAHEVYLACTPALAAQYLAAHAQAPATRGWDPEVLDRKIEAFGFGFLIVAGEQVSVHIKPWARTVAKDKLVELELALAATRVQ